MPVKSVTEAEGKVRAYYSKHDPLRHESKPANFKTRKNAKKDEWIVKFETTDGLRKKRHEWHINEKTGRVVSKD